MLYIINQQWESESFTYTSADYDVMMNDISDWLFNDDRYHADFVEDHPEKQTGEINTDDWIFYAFCQNQAEDAVDAAELYGSWTVGDLEVRVVA